MALAFCFVLVFKGMHYSSVPWNLVLEEVYQPGTANQEVSSLIWATELEKACMLSDRNGRHSYTTLVPTIFQDLPLFILYINCFGQPYFGGFFNPTEHSFLHKAILLDLFSLYNCISLDFSARLKWFKGSKTRNNFNFPAKSEYAV